MFIPTREELENNYVKYFHCNECKLLLNGRYETENAHDLDIERLSPQCVLFYEISIRTSNNDDITPKKISLFWYENVNKSFCNGRVAYLHLIEILPNFQRQGFGTKYAAAQHNTLPIYNIEYVYLKAAHYGSIFWTKMGYSFVNEALFWGHYQEYCEEYELEYREDIKSIPTNYFNWLRESKIEYDMFKKIEK